MQQTNTKQHKLDTHTLSAYERSGERRGVNVAIVKCSECAAQISSLAATCVKCGAPNQFFGLQAKPSATVALPNRGWLASTFAPRQRCAVCSDEGKINHVGWDGRSILILLILLCAMLIPGLIYFLWRGSKASQLCCARCKSTSVVRF
jgi:hypothetical protein